MRDAQGAAAALPARGVLHGKDVVVLALVYAGDIEEGEAATQALRSLGKPIADVVSPQPFAGFQPAFDPLLTPGARNYWKSHNFLELSDGLIDTLLEYAASAAVRRSPRSSSRRWAAPRAAWRPTPRPTRTATRASS